MLKRRTALRIRLTKTGKINRLRFLCEKPIFGRSFKKRIMEEGNAVRQLTKSLIARVLPFGFYGE